ncbi:MAG: PP2C family protein-serine/threonine phosphatase [Planctomycetes bacterium]|nr:PP2C family protein-serine/threonine phosphatase [Planctomycetota bacterium]
MRILHDADWQEQLRLIVDLMRDMSLHSDPQEMVRSYGEKLRALLPNDGRLSLSRRGLTAPTYRITRSTTWKENINPWKEKSRLPQLEGGLLARLIYANEPQIIDELQVSPDDPAFEYLSPHRSLMAIPMFDQGVALNMVVLLRNQPFAFAKEELPEVVWLSNLFGRATSNLVMSQDLQRANHALDREMKAVGNIQRSLLPAKIPTIPSLDLATHYQPSHRAGGDYYDFFPLPSGRWGIFIGDVSGHGTPAAVLMAVTHCMAHTNPGSAQTPAQVLQYLNHHLATLYTNQTGRFITAFYGIYNPADQTLTYACAGHNPPRLKRCQDGSLMDLDHASGLPLGIIPSTTYNEALLQLQPGDQILFYTDGIVEARNPAGKLFGTENLDRVLENCALQASGLLDEVLQSVADFVEGHPADDDRTLIVARVS